MRAGGVVSLTLAAALAVHAVRLAQAAPGDEARATLEQRIALTARLLSDSPTAQRIVASGHAQAAAHLDEGRLHHALSEDALRRGDLAGARKAADEALRHVAMARRLVPDTPARNAQARQRAEQMQSTLDRLVESWRQRAGPADADDGDLIIAQSLMGTAWRHASPLAISRCSTRFIAAALGRYTATLWPCAAIRIWLPTPCMKPLWHCLSGLMHLIPCVARLGPIWPVVLATPCSPVGRRTRWRCMSRTPSTT